MHFAFAIEVEKALTSRTKSASLTSLFFELIMAAPL